MLTPFGPGIWIADGDIVRAIAGFHFPTRMAVIRLPADPEGGLDRPGEPPALMVWSPTKLNPALRAEVAALGQVRHLVAPNDLHHLYLNDWAVAWPEARLYAPPGLRTKRPDLMFHADLGVAADAAWDGQVDQALMPGNTITTEVVFFHKASGTVLFTDLLQHMPRGWYSGWRAVVARLDGMTGPEPAVPHKFRLAFRDRPAARAALARIRAWPVRQILFAHGAPVTEDAPALLRRAFRWLER
ncbi:MAG: hypothetical protein U1C74_17575 [Phenylobacterium sp.]|nr:hypothetical protein [Phenylobacterium sp.]